MSDNQKNITETIGYVVSKDGTSIGYRQMGHGPGVILVHGGMMASQNFTELGKILAKDFTVYIPDRQGRGLSGTRVKHSLVAESEDIQALIEKTKAENIFGLSSGAIVSLQTAISTPSLKKVALYDPPITVGDSIPLTWYADYELAMSKGNIGKAFVIILKGLEDKSIFTFLPSFIIAPLMNILFKLQGKEIKNNEVPVAVLVSNFKYDYRIVRESERLLSECHHLKSEILLLGGTKSPHFSKVALNNLNTALLKAKRIELPGLGHMAADNSGKPEVVANKLKAFFSKIK